MHNKFKNIYLIAEVNKKVLNQFSMLTHSFSQKLVDKLTLKF